MDLSHLDSKYFLDGRRYNCPFCNRRSVAFSVTDQKRFHWSPDRTVFVYLVTCDEAACKKISMHLSDFYFEYTSAYGFTRRPTNLADTVEYNAENLDAYFFYHHPTSFFTIDN